MRTTARTPAVVLCGGRNLMPSPNKPGIGSRTRRCRRILVGHPDHRQALHSKARRRPNDRTSQQAEGPPAGALNPPPTKLHRPPRRPGTVRGHCQRDPTKANVHTLKQKPPLTRAECCARGGTRTGLQPLNFRPSPENLRNPAQSGRHTTRSEAAGEHIVHTFSFPGSAPAGLLRRR